MNELAASTGPLFNYGVLAIIVCGLYCLVFC